MLSFKQVESNHGKRDPLANGIVVGLLSFLIVWISDIVNVTIIFLIQTQNGCTRRMQEGKHLNNIWHFLKKI